MRHAYQLSADDIQELDAYEYVALKSYLPLFAPEGYEMVGDSAKGKTRVSERVVGDRKIRSIETTDFNEFTKFLRGEPNG